MLKSTLRKSLSKVEEIYQSRNRNKTLKVAVVCKGKDLLRKVRIQTLIWELDKDFGKK